jgi:hypothetical protein
MSITATLALVRRLQQANKPARILYVSDFDPAGQSMPVAVSRKVEYFVRKFGLDLDIRIFPVVLTLEQVQTYQLPRTPIKESERRREGFEARHGQGAVELDALEALYPGQLRQIVAQYLEVYYDTSLDERVQEQRELVKQDLQRVWEEVTRWYQGDVQQLRDEYEAIRRDFEVQISGCTERLRSLWQAIKSDLNQNTPALDPIPDSYSVGEVGDGLYNSDREYLTQIEAYKQFQGRV